MISLGLVRYLSCVAIPKEHYTLAGIRECNWVSIAGGGEPGSSVWSYIDRKVAAFLDTVHYNQRALVHSQLFPVQYLGEGDVRGDLYPSSLHYLSSIKL